MNAAPISFFRIVRRKFSGHPQERGNNKKNYFCARSTLLMLIFLCAGFSFSFEDREEIRPVRIRTAAETEAGHSVEKMLDGDPNTWASFLDETRTGKNLKTLPPGGSTPVDVSLVLDLGRIRAVSGIRFTARISWVPFMAKKVSVFACGDEQGKTDPVCLKENVTLPPVHSGNSVFVLWPVRNTRYLAVRFSGSFEEKPVMPENSCKYSVLTGKFYEQLHENEWWQNSFVNWFDRFKMPPERSGSGSRFLISIAELSCFSELPCDYAGANSPDLACPQARIERDWILQDHGTEIGQCFRSAENAEVEIKMVKTVLSEIQDNPKYGELNQRCQKLTDTRITGNDSRWKKLYFDACRVRRAERLAELLEETKQIVYVKHYVFGGWTITEQTEYETDEQYKEYTPEWRPGGQLCLASIHSDGSVEQETLIDRPDGCVRDPALSRDGKTLFFSMRKNYQDDDFHLWKMDLATRQIRQITFDPIVDGKRVPCSDIEPCVTAEDKIIFQSTRCAQIDICKPHVCSNLYTCDQDGKEMTRLGFDQLHTFYPQTLDDGRITYTRWEYNDRNPLYIQPLFVMNSDGTGQTEYYGNNSMYPVSVIHARGIPGTAKVMAVISGHHVLQKGALAIIDRTRGTQGNDGIEFIESASPVSRSNRHFSDVPNTDAADTFFDFFGHAGPQYQYPFPLNENSFLVAFNPEGSYLLKGPLSVPMGIYWMSSSGERELLAFDWSNSCGQAAAVRPCQSSHRRISPVKPDESFGSFYVRDIYQGPGLAGIERGTIKKLRVIALEYRAAWIGDGMNSGEAGTGTVHTPISINSGSWDVKHVLGEVDIEADGSAYFKVPARTPVYFQLLDEKGQCVQSMRSWATLQGGEQFGCVGCHENKNDAAPMQKNQLTALAVKKAPQKLRPSFGRPHPLMTRLEKENILDSLEAFLGVNAVCRLDPEAPIAGFSYRQLVQPILDRHCVQCHQGTPDSPDPKMRSSLRLTGEVQSVQGKTLGKRNHYRNYTRSYLELTDYGNAQGSKWVTWYNPRARAKMLEPNFCGSTKSPLMNFLEKSHYGVDLTRTEKEIIACWIDLAVPFCGSCAEANSWSEQQKQEYQYYQNKRVVFAQEELQIQRKIAVSAKQGEK